MPKLKNAHWERFAQAIFRGLSEHDAYLEAGYKASGDAVYVNASKLLRKAKVEARIQELQSKVERKNILSVQKRKEILSQIGGSQLSDYIVLTPDGDQAIAYDKDSPNPRAVQEVTEQLVEKSDEVTIRKKKLKLHSPISAIQELNKMDGAYAPDKLNVRIEDLDDEIGRGLARLAGKRKGSTARKD